MMMSIKDIPYVYGWLAVACLSLVWSLGTFANTQSVEELNVLDPASYQPLVFADIPATKYELRDGVLRAIVDKSSSALLLSFKTPRKIVGLQATWRMDGKLATSTASEQTKKGDDFPLRIGLLLSGKAPLVPFFAPAWIKAVKAHMQHPAAELMYFLFGAKASAGAQWKSPYTDSINNVAMPSQPQMEGWTHSRLTFPEKDVVGIWLMADGDNSGSTFVTSIRQLSFDYVSH